MTEQGPTCPVCGHLALNDGRCPNCEAHAQVTGGRHSDEMLAVKHAAERRVREEHHMKWCAFVVCTGCGAFVTNDKWQVTRCTMDHAVKVLIPCACDAPLRVKRYTAPPRNPWRDWDEKDIAAELAPWPSSEPERQTFGVTPAGGLDAPSFRAWMKHRARAAGWTGLRWEEEIDEHGNPMGRLTGVKG